MPLIPLSTIAMTVFGRMSRMAATIALPLVGIGKRTARRDVFGDEVVTALFVGVITPPAAGLSRLPRCHPAKRWTVMGIRPMTYALIGAPT